MYKKMLTISMVLLLVLSGCSKKEGNTLAPGEIGGGGGGGNIGGGDGPVLVDGLESQDQIDVVYIEDSFYFNEFDTNTMILVKEIKDGIRKADTEIRLSSVLDTDVAKRIMNIIWLDEPEFFYLNPSVEFVFDGNKKVREVKPSYAISNIDEINRIKKRSDTYVGSLSSSGEKASNYAHFLKLYDKSKGSVALCSKNENIGENFVGDSANNITGGINSSGCLSTQGRSKTNSMFLRNNGIQSMVVYGEFYSDLYKDNAMSIPEFKEASITYEADDTRAYYAVDASSMYAWNMVQMNDKFYHWDAAVDSLISKSVVGDRFGGNNNYQGSVLVNDLTNSQSKLSYHNESMLGVLPMAESNNFTYYFRKNRYIPETKPEAMDKRIGAYVDEMVSSSNYQYALIQFETIDNYSYFEENLERILEIKNKDAIKKVKGYELISIPEHLILYIVNVER